MSEQQHAPELWQQDKDRPHLVVDADGNWVAWCMASRPGKEGEDVERARLIAAAPDLLAVVDELLATATIETPSQLIEIAGKAMCKAKGESA